MKLRSSFLFVVLAVFAAGTWAQAQIGFDQASVRNSSGQQVAINPQLDPTPTVGDWTTNTPVPIVNGLSQTTVATGSDGTVYSFGGGLGAGPDVTINQTWAYDPVGNSWTQLANMSTPLRAFGSAVTVEDKVYIFGGFDGAAVLNTLRIYDIASDSWSTGAPLPSPSFGVAVGIVNGRIFVAGGSGAPNALLEYDIASDTYTPLASMPGALVRTHGAGVDALNEFHVFANGFDGRDHLIYDVEGNTWRTGAPMPIGVTDPGVVAIGTDIFVLGGIGGPGRTQIFDAAAGTWSTGPAMPGPTNNTSATQSGDAIFVIGGFDGATSIPVNYSLDVSAPAGSQR